MNVVIESNTRVITIERLRARTTPWFFGHFWKCSEVVEFWHVDLVLLDIHCFDFFFAGLCFVLLLLLIRLKENIRSSQWQPELKQENYLTMAKCNLHLFGQVDDMSFLDQIKTVVKEDQFNPSIISNLYLLTPVWYEQVGCKKSLVSCVTIK